MAQTSEIINAGESLKSFIIPTIDTGKVVRRNITFILITRQTAFRDCVSSRFCWPNFGLLNNLYIMRILLTSKITAGMKAYINAVIIDIIVTE